MVVCDLQSQGEVFGFFVFKISMDFVFHWLGGLLGVVGFFLLGYLLLLLMLM